MNILFRLLCAGGGILSLVGNVDAKTYPVEKAKQVEPLNKKEGTRLPLPRFASLRSCEVNCHFGPGQEYPVDCQYKRLNLPIEIIAEFDFWRQVRDYQGYTGWVHKSLLSGNRHVIIQKTVDVVEAPHKETPVVLAHVEPGVVARIVSCDQRWCLLRFTSDNSNIKGWVKREFLWGLYPNEHTSKE